MIQKYVPGCLLSWMDRKFAAKNIFGMWVEHSRSQPTDNKLSLKWAWSRHVTNFAVLVP